MIAILFSQIMSLPSPLWPWFFLKCMNFLTELLIDWNKRRTGDGWSYDQLQAVKGYQIKIFDLIKQLKHHMINNRCFYV